MTDDGSPRPGSRTPFAAWQLGCASLGNLFTEVPDEQAAATIAAAWDGGVRSFDTAPHYGLGLSERRLGAALRDRPRAEFTVSTKVGRLLERVVGSAADPWGDDLDNGFAVPATHRRLWDFSADGVRRSLEASLDRLGLDRIDTVLIHDPDDHEVQALNEAYPALEKLRAEGVIGAIGVGMNQSRIPLRFVRETDIDCILLAGRYTLLDRSGTELLDACAERGVAVAIGGVFNSGLLVDPKPTATFDYRTVAPDVLDKALYLKEICALHGVLLRAAALAFPRRHPAVTSVLIGARSPEEVRDCLELGGADLPEALWTDLARAGF